MADIDPLDPDAAIARNRAMASNANDKLFNEAVAAQIKAAMGNPGSAGGWLAATGVPYNVTVGAYKAALNIIESGTDVLDAAMPKPKEGAPVPVMPTPKPIREQFPGFFENAHAFADAATANNTTSDDIVQGVAQFALPFAGYLKLAGGIGGASTVAKVVRGAMAEGAAASTAFDPNEGRFADLVQLGLESEGRFGDLLRKVAPDGSLINQYIDYMTSRGGSRIEERFKNAVDSLAVSAALGGIIKSAAVSMRAARKLAAEPMKVGRAAQTGTLGVEPSAQEISDIELMRARKNTIVEEGGEHVVLEGDTLPSADVVQFRDPVASNLDKLLNRSARRMAAESQGQAILDDLVESGVSTREVSDRFWNETYFKLDAQQQARVQRYVKSMGFEPGAVSHVDAQGQKFVLEGWADAGRFVSDDLAANPEQLEGGERGFVAMMQYLNAAHWTGK